MSSTTAPALPDSPAELLRAVRDQKKAADKADVEMMRLAVHWADLHIADPEFAEACFTSPEDVRRRRVPVDRRVLCAGVRDHARSDQRQCGAVPHRLRRGRLPPPAAVGRGPVRPGRGVAGADHRADHPGPDPGGRDPRRRAGLLVRLPADALAAAAGGRRGPGAVHARRRARSHWTTRRTSGTSRSTPSRRRSTGPCTSRPTWRSPTPWRWPRRCPRVRSTSRSSGPPTPPTAAAPPRSATWLGTR